MIIYDIFNQKKREIEINALYLQHNSRNRILIGLVKDGRLSIITQTTHIMIIKKVFLFTILLSMVVIKALAHDFSVEHANSLTIYYNFINDATQLEVTYYSYYTNNYSGKVIIPNVVTYKNKTLKVTHIGEYAFHGCTSLTSITIPNSVTSINKNAFAGCTNLASIIVDAGNSTYDSRENCNAVIESSTNTLVVGCKTSTIPQSVTSIGYPAFAGCSGLTSITIPNHVTSINKNAFSDCTNLASIIVDAGNSTYDSRENCNAVIESSTNTLVVGCKTSTIPNSVTTIGNSAFASCRNLTTITIPNSVSSIGEYTFYECSSLTHIAILDGVSSIGMYAFANCSGLTSVTIPNSVVSIGDEAFSGCSGLTSITIGNCVKSIGISAFYWCRSLTTVTIPNSVTSIGRLAFRGCTRLTSVTIGNNVTSIGNGAFLGCNISEVISNIENPFSLYINTFDNPTLRFATLYVPAGTIDKYKRTEGWKGFENIKSSTSTVFDLGKTHN